MGCRMTKRSKKKVAENENTNGGCPSNLNNMKRKDLQKLCKSLNLKAGGKNVDLIERLQAHYEQHELKELTNNKTEQSKELCINQHAESNELINKTTEESNELSNNMPEESNELSNNMPEESNELSSNMPEETNDGKEESKQKDNESNDRVEENAENINNCDVVDLAVSNVCDEECDENVSVQTSPKELAASVSNTSSPKDWNWIARWCVVDGVLKQDAAERWVLLRLIGGRTVIVDEKTKERFDFVLEPTVLPTPDSYEDNYICGDCVRKNRENLSGWIGIKKATLTETPKSSLGKENCVDSLLRQSFKRKREESLSPRADLIDCVNTPMKMRRLNPRSCSPASPQVRRERGEEFQLPKNLLKPWKPKKAKKTPPKEDPDFAQKVEKIITDLSPDEQLHLVFGGKNILMHSPPHTKKTLSS